MTDDQFDSFMQGQERLLEALARRPAVPNLYKWVAGVLGVLAAAAVIAMVDVRGNQLVHGREIHLIREDIRDLRQTLAENIDDRWRKRDHDAYAQQIERRMVKLESYEHLSKSDVQEIMRGIIRYPWDEDKKVVERRLGDLEKRMYELERANGK